jgi:GNAT superfamily N-acetyltransferase
MRKASQDDIERLVTLMGEFYAEGGYPLERGRAARVFVDLVANERLGQVWLIEAESHAVGHLVVTLCFSMEFGGMIAIVDDLYVQPAYRGRGLATAALAEARGWCAGRGIRAMKVETGPDNAAAQAVYRRAGFVAKTDRVLMAAGLAEPTHVG